jgi:hypothetical protein
MKRIIKIIPFLLTILVLLSCYHTWPVSSGHGKWGIYIKSKKDKQPSKKYEIEFLPSHQDYDSKGVYIDYNYWPYLNGEEWHDKYEGLSFGVQIFVNKKLFLVKEMPNFRLNGYYLLDGVITDYYDKEVEYKANFKFNFDFSSFEDGIMNISFSIVAVNYYSRLYNYQPLNDNSDRTFIKITDGRVHLTKKGKYAFHLYNGNA